MAGMAMAVKLCGYGVKSAMLAVRCNIQRNLLPRNGTGGTMSRLKKGTPVWEVYIENHFLYPKILVRKHIINKFVGGKTDEGESDNGYDLLTQFGDKYIALGYYMPEYAYTSYELGCRKHYTNNREFVFKEEDIPKAKKDMICNKVKNMYAELRVYEKLKEKIMQEEECQN